MGYFNVLADLVGGGHDGTRMRFTKKKKKTRKGMSSFDTFLPAYQAREVMSDHGGFEGQYKGF